MQNADGGSTSTRITPERAEELVVRTVQQASRRPGPRGGLTNQHLGELRSALAYFVIARFRSRFTMVEAEQLADHAVVAVQAPLHVRLAVLDLRSRDDPVPLEQLLMRAAEDAALDAILLREQGDSQHITARLTEDDVAAAAFGQGVSSVAIRQVLCDLVGEGRREECLVTQSYLDLVEENAGEPPRDQDVAARAGVLVSQVQAALFRVKSRLGSRG